MILPFAVQEYSSLLFEENIIFSFPFNILSML